MVSEGSIINMVHLALFFLLCIFWSFWTMNMKILNRHSSSRILWIQYLYVVFVFHHKCKYPTNVCLMHTDDTFLSDTLISITYTVHKTFQSKVVNASSLSYIFKLLLFFLFLSFGFLWSSKITDIRCSHIQGIYHFHWHMQGLIILMFLPNHLWNEDVRNYSIH